MSPEGPPAAGPARWMRIEELFVRVVDLPAARRSAVLAAECGEDPALKNEVESLVAEHASDPDFLEPLPPWLAPRGEDAGAGPEKVPRRIGPYRVLRRLGRGGMGSVYLAERRAADFEQEVAIKLVRRGLDSEDVLARFRAERRILARLTHPNIARLLDVGALDDGRPYLVMEHVDGEPLRAHCDARQLDVEQRLRLVEAVCGAVEHAHRRLVVHRDLKPGNILVTDEGVPKLLDFGIAKILDSDAGEGAGRGLTRLGQRVLTPEYAAPEQVRGQPVTTAVDVYAVGILLYELLADRHPVAASLGRPGAARSPADVERAVLELDPPRPSAARAQAAGSASRGPHVGRDLDHIVLKALRKEPEARYPSVAALAADLRRYLEGFPVEARASTASYRAARFIRRNPRLVGVAAVAVALLLLSTGVVAYQSSRIRAESARVAQERDKALEVRGFLLESFGGTGPDEVAGEAVTARTLLDERAATLDRDFADDPEMKAEMLMVLAEAYDRLGLHGEAEPLARRALEIRTEHFGPAHADVVSSLDLLGWILHERGRPEDAEPLLREAVRLGREIFPAEGSPRLARALNDLGVVREAAGDWDEAGALYRESLDMRSRLGEEGTRGSAITRSNLAVILYRRGDLDSAIETAEDALVHFRQAFGPDHRRTITVQSNLAAMRAVRGDHAGAEAEHRDIVERQRRRLGADHPRVAFSLSMLANELVAQDRPGEAVPLLDEALEIQRHALGPDHPDLAPTLRVLGGARVALGRPDEALAALEEALEIVVVVRGRTHHEVAALLSKIADAHLAAGRLDPAVRAAAEAYDTSREIFGPDHLSTASHAVMLARIHLARGDTAAMAPLTAEVAGALEGAGASADHPLYRWLERLRGEVGAARSTGGSTR